MAWASELRAAFPSYGPAWEAAIDYGIDVSMLSDFLSLSPEGRARRVRTEERGEVTTDTGALLHRLVTAGVEFVVVGGMAARAYGSAMFTDDLDITAPLPVENLRRLVAAREGLHPRHTMTPDKRPVTETAEYFASYKNLYLLTDLGRLDVLGSVPPVGSFEAIAERAEETTVLGPKVRVISMDDLITIKAAIGRPKDRHVELELRAIRELRAARK